MKIAAIRREVVPPEKRALRGVLTVVFALGGIVLGVFVAQTYNNLLIIKPGPTSRYLAGAPLSEAGQIWAIVAFAVVGALSGFLASSVVYRWVVGAQAALESMSAKEKFALFLGLVFGLVLTLLITFNFRMPWPFTLSIAALLCYLCVSAMMSVKEQLSFYYPAPPGPDVTEPEAPPQQPKILDTSVIIDGRILDVCRTGFVEGPVLIPRFVLDELQHIADSNDSLKRARGRRGLDILNQMRKELGMKITMIEAPKSASAVTEVDAKLVAAALDLGAAIITNDFNLNKVAELQGVAVLNVNELANSLKPVVLPGEEMSVTVIREGKEPNQGVAYLDDGTMVVVENAKRLIGERVEVEVVSVWQTVAGKMIFASLKGEGNHGDYPGEHGKPGGQRSRRHTQ